MCVNKIRIYFIIKPDEGLDPSFETVVVPKELFTVL